MIGEHITECAVLSHGDSLRAGKVILGDDSVGHLVVRADEDRRLTADYTFDSASIAIVHKN